MAPLYTGGSAVASLSHRFLRQCLAGDDPMWGARHTKSSVERLSQRRMRNSLTREGLAGMHRYHFHLVDGIEFFDSSGVLLVDDAAARMHAESLATKCATSKTDSHVTGIRVTTESGGILCRLLVRR
jgi:hypothetical protein